MVDPAETCGWCGKPATTKIIVRKGVHPANVCADHEAHFERQGVISERMKLDKYRPKGAR